jgi:NTP pyrophosphatase (non-canonical NTP hydrolase)
MEQIGRLGMENFTNRMINAIEHAKVITKQSECGRIEVEAIALGVISLKDTPIRSAFTHYKIDIEEFISILYKRLRIRSKSVPVSDSSTGVEFAPNAKLLLDILNTEGGLTLSKMFLSLINGCGHINDALFDSCTDFSECYTMLESLRPEVCSTGTAMNRYVKNAIKTESLIGDVTLEDGRKISSRIIHGIDGCVTEAGELQDAMKRHMFYGKELDLVNLKEEIGDIMWYLAILVDELGTSFEELGDINIKKLSSRYPEKFTSENALNRDLDKERDILEGVKVPQRPVRPEPLVLKEGELPEPPIKPEKRMINEDVDFVKVFGLFLDLMKETKGIAKEKFWEREILGKK